LSLPNPPVSRRSQSKVQFEALKPALLSTPVRLFVRENPSYNTSKDRILTLKALVLRRWFDNSFDLQAFAITGQQMVYSKALPKQTLRLLLPEESSNKIGSYQFTAM